MNNKLISINPADIYFLIDEVKKRGGSLFCFGILWYN